LSYSFRNVNAAERFQMHFMDDVLYLRCLMYAKQDTERLFFV